MRAMKGKAIGLLLVGLLVGYSAGCHATGIEHVSGDEFQSLCAEGQRVNSAYWTQAIGATSGRAYLEHGELVTSTGAPRIQVYWTELTNLPEAFLLDWASLGSRAKEALGTVAPNLQNGRGD